MRTNEERAASIRKAADNIEREYDSLELTFYVTGDENDRVGVPSCNTPACIGGHLAYQFDPVGFRRRVLGRSYDEVAEVVHDLACEVVDPRWVRDPEGHYWGHIFSTYARHWPEPFLPAYGKHPATTAPAMLRRLAELVEAGHAPGRTPRRRRRSTSARVGILELSDVWEPVAVYDDEADKEVWASPTPTQDTP